MLDSIEKVKKFVSITNKYDFEIGLSSDRYVIDGKSIMGIFSIDLKKPIKLIAHTKDQDEFLKDIKGFIIKNK